MMNEVIYSLACPAMHKNQVRKSQVREQHLYRATRLTHGT